MVPNGPGFDPPPDEGFYRVTLPFVVVNSKDPKQKENHPLQEGKKDLQQAVLELDGYTRNDYIVRA